VLKGDMSLVGPRPHAVAHDERFTELITRYANRWQVKPGITGLAQIAGFRGETETPEKMERRLEQDLIYVNNWSLWLDLKILALTTVRCITGKNAY
jgi:putative colanic acid biosynthesis UDP-glucose lipid carrier transferase